MDSFTALAEPNRRAIVEMLRDGERAAGEIVARFDMSAPAVSQHLKVLRESGIVKVRADRQRRLYSLDPHGLDEMAAWIERTRKTWTGDLDRLERALASDDGDGEGGSHA